jgi:hypothetical protein
MEPILTIPGEGEVRPESARAELRILARATRNEWPIPDELRARAVSIVAAVLDLHAGDNLRLRSLQLLAVRTLGLLDALNVRRERNGIAERGQAVDAQVGALRELLATPEGRKALCKLTELQPAQPAAGSSPADRAAGEDVPSCEGPTSFPFKD